MAEAIGDGGCPPGDHRRDVSERVKVKNVVVCASQVPFRSGGAELHVASLVSQLRERGYRAELVQLPFKWYPRAQILKSCLAWRLLDLSESDGDPIDLVIATKFPSYAVKHPNKVTWLIHQFRQVYDQHGTTLSDFTDSPEDVAYREAIMSVDNRVLAESRRIFANAQNTADRLYRYNGLAAEPLYHPPKLAEVLACEEYGDFFLAVSRLDRSKRMDLVIQALKYSEPEVRLVIAGTGPEASRLAQLVDELGVGDRVKLLGYVSEAELVRLYGRCRAVVFVPFDEDYGYITLEAFAAEKAVVTAQDSGGVLEFVEDGRSGYVTDGRPESIAARLNELWSNRDRAIVLGKEGKERIRDITWDYAIDQLVSD